MSHLVEQVMQIAAIISVALPVTYFGVRLVDYILFWEPFEDDDGGVA